MGEWEIKYLAMIGDLAKMIISSKPKSIQKFHTLMMFHHFPPLNQWNPTAKMDRNAMVAGTLDPIQVYVPWTW